MDTFHFLAGRITDAIIDPSSASLVPLFLFAFLNDLIGIFPFALFLAGQLVFYQGVITLAFWMKLVVFVAVPVGIGSTVGSIPFYLLAYFGGKPLIVKYQPFFKRFLRFDWQNVEKASAYFKGVWYDELIFLLLRSTPIIPSIPLDLAGGTLRMGFMPFFVLTAVGTIVRMMITLLAFSLSLHGLHGLSQL
jgi:membrane protein YqaA with SNARE-associated domain